MTNPTAGTTANLARMGTIGVLVSIAVLLCVVVALTRGVPVESVAEVRVEALRQVGSIAFAGLAALGGIGGLGSVAHGARHWGGPPAPTSAEIRTFTTPAPVGPEAP